MKFSIPVNTVKALLLSAGKNDIRYYLNGICLDVRQHDAVAVSTNGQILVALPIVPVADDDGAVPYQTGQFIVPRELLEQVKPTFKTADVTIEIVQRPPTVEPGTATIKHVPTVALHCCGTTITGNLIDGTFPDWRRAVPTQVSGLVSQFDADYVATFGKINKLLGSKDSPAIAHNGGKDGADGVARVLLTDNVLGVIMPMRWDGAGDSLNYPAWLQRTSVPTAVPAAAAA